MRVPPTERERYLFLFVGLGLLSGSLYGLSLLLNGTEASAIIGVALVASVGLGLSLYCLNRAAPVRYLSLYLGVCIIVGDIKFVVTRVSEQAGSVSAGHVIGLAMCVALGVYFLRRVLPR